MDTDDPAALAAATTETHSPAGVDHRPVPPATITDDGGGQLMPDERDSPSDGWQGVYGAMGVSTSAECDSRPCPDCGDRSRRVREGRFRCPEHGHWDAGERRAAG